MTDEMKAAQYTKDRCPCYRCKKIVAELEHTVKAQREVIETFVIIIEDRDATILRLRELLKELWRNTERVGYSNYCPICGINGGDHKPDCELKREIEVKNE